MSIKIRINIIILFLYFGITLGYYSLKLNKISSPISKNSSEFITNETENKLTEEELEELEEYIDLPLNMTDLSMLNEPYIKTRNLHSELYTIDIYLGSNKQYFRLLLSSVDNFNTLSSINCKSCNVSNKYDYSLSNTFINYDEINSKQNTNYKFLVDKCSILTNSAKNEINNITIDYFLFKLIESDKSGFLNSSLIDGILSLSYNRNSQMPNKNFIIELYKEGKISSPSFSIFITSSNVNRLYLGNIMKNEYVNNYVNTSMNKGKCSIIDNSWKCRIKKIGYTDFKYHSSSHTKEANSEVKFNLTEKDLTIPSSFYSLLVVGYRYVTRKSGDTYYTTTEYNKYCTTYWGGIYCSCSGKNAFGIATFYFNKNSRLDIDLRDYVSYDKTSYIFKCKVDIILSDKNEFIVGLRGLNNTIMSFDLEDQKIEFFYKKKYSNHRSWLMIILSILFVIFFFLLIIIIKAKC